MMPSLRGVFVMTALLAVALALPSAYASVTVEGVYGKTVIAEIVNESDDGVTRVMMWLDGGRFESCNAQNGWTCAISPENLVVFDPPEPLPSGESARLALVTDGPAPAIFWKTMDGEDDLEKGTMRPDREPDRGKTDPAGARDAGDPGAGPSDPAITDKSVFRLVPEKPNVGSTVRVIGQMLGALQQFDFYIGSDKIGTFRTDESGSFVGTARISEGMDSGRVDFKLSSAEHHREISLRIGDAKTRILAPLNTDLTINNAPDTVRRGDLVDISGTGKPNSAITAEIRAPDGSIINSMIARIDSRGVWGIDEPVTIPANAQLGLHTATITDGRQTITKQWTVEAGRTIDIKPVKLKFSPGETMAFRGTAAPNAQVLASIEGPNGKEITSDVIETGGSGDVSFEFPTTKTTLTGTYTLIATVGPDREFIYAGLGVLPSTPVNLELDRFHYDPGATATIMLSGGGSDTLELIIVDDSNSREVARESVRLGPDGRGTHTLELEALKNTIYSAIAKKGNNQSEEKFAINLKKNPSDLTIHTTKAKYLPGEPMLITGNTMEVYRVSDPKIKSRPPVCPDEAPIYLVIITLVSPDGEDVRQKSSFANNKCQISDRTFRVPADAGSGTWTVRADSGLKSSVAEFEVLDEGANGIQITVEKGQDISRQESLDIHVTGGKQKVTITIESPDGDTVATLLFPANEDGEVNQPWLVPADIDPGVYTFRASYDRQNFAETTYEITE